MEAVEYIALGIIGLLIVAAVIVAGVCVWHSHKYGSDIDGNGML